MAKKDEGKRKNVIVTKERERERDKEWKIKSGKEDIGVSDSDDKRTNEECGKSERKKEEIGFDLI